LTRALLTLHEALTSAVSRLTAANVPSPRMNAELLLMFTLGCDRAYLHAHPERKLTSDERGHYDQALAERIRGVPAQYITGHQEFWGMDLIVTPAVLIPRPETEHVVEAVLDCVGRAPSPAALCLVDVGTGSGCIAIALAKELPGAKFCATDISSAAVAKRNAARHGFSDRIDFVESNLLERLIVSPLVYPALRGATRHSPLFFDLIVSNPPYVGRREAATLPREVREHEPEIALYGGEEGYELYAALIAQSGQLLKPSGILVLELGHDSLPAVQPLLDPANWTNVGVTKDLAGIPRVLAAEKL
jgi:release factor glutamine methyltransferase